MRDDEALPETQRIPNDAPRGRFDSRVRLRPKVSPEAGRLPAWQLGAVAVKGSIEWLEAQQLLDELGQNQFLLDDLLQTVDPSDDRVRSILVVREALAAVFRISASRAVHRAFLPEAPLAEYVVGVYSWLFAVIGALGETDPATYAWRIEQARNFHFDELHQDIRADLSRPLPRAAMSASPRRSARVRAACFRPPARSRCVSTRRGIDVYSAVMPTMVHEVLAETTKRYGDRPALRVKRDGGWRTTTWNAYAREARRAGRAFVKLGVEPGTGVTLIGQNCPEWLFADVGAILAGAVPAGIYTTNSAEQVRYITEHCDAKVAFADTPEQVTKFVVEQERMPRLEVVVQMIGAPAETTRGRLRVLSWEDFLSLGEETPESELDARIAAQKPDDVCTLIYTSGTTGDPKAVMISHTNMVWTADACRRMLSLDANEVTVSYLPLSHIAEQMLTVHAPMATGSVLYFAESIEKLGETLKEVRPTVFLGVPRVWEKIQAKMVAAGAAAPPLRKKIAAWARKVGLAAGYAEQRGDARPLVLPIAKKIVFDKVRERLGLDRARICVTSAAPISKDTLEFFLSLGIPLLEVFGMSECTGPATYSPPDNYRTGKCGIVIPGGEIKIAEDGEICMRGPHVFKGYLKDPETTKNTIDADGWLHSGDIGEIDQDGFLKITDRKKDLLITAGGENIAPQVLEGHLKGIPVVGQAVVVGDRMKYLAALLTLDPERVKSEAELAGSAASTVAEAAKCNVFKKHLQKQIDQVNDKLARVQTIKKFVVVPNEFSIEGGELTPTMKVKRKVVNEKYRAEIDSMYAEAAEGIAASP
jgi:long-subunit acyl-CoA synthetase (AMP-forming)